MELPIIRTAGNEHWDCQACGICCRGSIVPLSDADVARLDEQHWDEDPQFKGKTYYVRASLGSGRMRLAHQADGCCVFLTPEGRCRVHEKFGFENKPVICRTFPLQLIPHEKQTVLTLRRACPSAALDQGRPLAEHLPDVKKLVADGSLKVTPPHAPPVQTSSILAADIAWNYAGRVLAATARIFGDERFPPVRRVVHAILFARLLEKAKLKKLNAEQFGELVDLLERSVPGEVGELFLNRQAPSSLGRMLFRLTAAEYVRLHADYRPPAGFFARGHLARSIWKMFRGRGQLPNLHPQFPAVDFATLEEPLASSNTAFLRPELQRPLERYLATTAASYQFALANRGQWSLVQSIRALAMTFPMALYLLRWATAGREPTKNDVALIVSTLDRGQGFASLAGPRYRWTLDILEFQGDLERLAVWYAR